MFIEEPIKINKNDIFNYVVGKSQFDPIEHCIDPTRYEVQECFIYDHERRQRQKQTEEFAFFNKEVYKLRGIIQDPHKPISRGEIIKICKELEEIAPTTIKLPDSHGDFDLREPYSAEARQKIQKLFGGLKGRRNFGDIKRDSSEDE